MPRPYLIGLVCSRDDDRWQGQSECSDVGGRWLLVQRVGLCISAPDRYPPKKKTQGLITTAMVDAQNAGQ